MRMTPDTGLSAADWLNGSDEGTLAAAFRDWADERRARALAREVARRRATRAFAVSDDLVGAIRAVLGPRSGPDDFARLFQAVRIAVNGEIERLARALPALLDLVAPLGVLAVIAYHSGEDRLVKQVFADAASGGCVCPPGLPCVCGAVARHRLVFRGARKPSPEEVAANPRAESGRLRAIVRTQADGLDEEPAAEVEL